MKLRHSYIAAAACALVAGQASALTKAGTAAAQVQAYLSGSSALKAVIAGLISQNAQAGSFTTFKSAGASFGDFKADGVTPNDGASYNIYSATMIAGNDFGLPAGTTVALHTRQKGGSYYGVVPVAKNTAIAFLDLNSCTDGANTCTGTINRAPDGGISDEEPAIFAFSGNVPAGQPAVTVKASDYLQPPKAVAAQVFGVAVSNALFTALGGTIGGGNVPTAVPSVPKAGIATLIQSGYDLSLGWTPIGLNSFNGQTICRRANGSGTQAAFNLKFFDYGSSTAVVLPSAASDSSVAAPSATPGDLYINEASSSDNVIACLNQANAAGAYAIGVLTLDKDPSATANGQGWNFVKLDGLQPSRGNAQNGSYDFYFESTIQISKLAPSANATDSGAFLRVFRDQFGLTKNIAQLSAEGQLGVAALPSNWPSTPSNPNDTVFGSKVTRNGDSRNPSTFSK